MKYNIHLYQGLKFNGKYNIKKAVVTRQFYCHLNACSRLGGYRYKLIVGKANL